MEAQHRTGVVCLAAIMVIALLGSGGCAIQREITYEKGKGAYVYGFPLVIMDETRRAMTAYPSPCEDGAPINQFGYLRDPVSPDFKTVVRISMNSLWSGAWLDLKDGPIVLSVPDAGKFPIAVRGLNMWTDVFGTVGSRTPERKSGNYLIAGPGWEGAPPADIKEVFHCSTRYAWILAEMSFNSPADFPALHALQDKLIVTPLAEWGKPYKAPANVPVDPSVDLTATPFDHVRLMTGEMFFARLAECLKDNRPYATDKDPLSWMKAVGVEPGKEYDASRLSSEDRKIVNSIPPEIWKDFATGPFTMKTQNGWINMLDIARFGKDYITRGYVAYMGLGASIREDITYPTAFVDGDGNVLDGSRKYVIHFDKGNLPPSRTGVWSISTYRENFYVHNPINRYGMLQTGPKYNADGSLDIYLQGTSPGSDREANWQPCPPSEPFNVTLRIYQPTEAGLNNTYKIPPIQKVK